jgi:uncharacterized membrane-anchored protein YjiN (DUF445 family)
MNTVEKQKQLQKHKALATGLFLLMALVFVAMAILQKQSHAPWIGFVRAFAEASMVGALADWFAVTALFHHPFGLKIPHTNLIENSKEKIGDNLGQFVVDNFLSPQNIRPYIEKIQISTLAADFLSQENNRIKLIDEVSKIVMDILDKVEDEIVIQFIKKKAEEMTSNINISKIISQGLRYLLEKEEHQSLITNLSAQIKKYISKNENIIREKVGDNSFAFVPKFIDNKIADKIIKGLVDFFAEVETQKNHSLRMEITNKLEVFALTLQTDSNWEEKFKVLKNDFLNNEKIEIYAQEIWHSTKKTLLNDLANTNSGIKKYADKNLILLSENLKTDKKTQEKTDKIVKSTVYKYILRNTKKFSVLISKTVGNWQGKELSEKLELEVGKDLQFIRINGTLVGGLVGLLLYTISYFLL